MRYLLVLTLLFTPSAWAENNGEANTCHGLQGAVVVSLQGKLFYDDSPVPPGPWQEARLDQVLCKGSRVRVGTNSRATVRLPSGISVRLAADTIIALKEVNVDQPTWLSLIQGFLHTLSRTPKRLTIETPIANAGPEGTEFALSVDGGKANLWVYEGGVRFYNDKGSIQLKPGQAAEALAGQAPQTRIDINPKEAVNWALYYPPLLPSPAKANTLEPLLRIALADYRQGKLDSALQRLEKLAPGGQPADFYKVRAALRLIAGQEQSAEEDVQAAFKQNPNDADALALQSVRALSQNRKDEAHDLAVKATKLDSQSAIAFSALSYTEQGRFELDKAQAAANQAVKLAPDDGLAWARKAELELSQGLTKESRQSARKALTLEPNLERTQTIMGFAHLLHMDTAEALQSFNQAVKLDSVSPLARLGLGLAKIREGDLEQGREDLETAATLDPSNSLVRSYLGKAYYEERRAKLADDQFELAKERDPKDPTPYFYGAINKQTTNRPVEALHDMQKAIELNDNRGVYRSKLMLDSDNAARNTAQGRIYNDLGFQQRGLLEGWNSVNQDPSNYSAHRLLADNYAVLSRHEISRISELLKSQLLQPVNITPVQPQVAESNILILDGLGSSIGSFNEYNPLFTRDRFALQASGFYGSHDTKSDELVHSGVWNRFSYSLGQFHYQTDGYRPNNDLSKDIYSAFGQVSITQNTSVQAELRRSEQNNGDISQDFFPSGLAKLPEEAPVSQAYMGSSLAKRQRLVNNLARMGLHHAFSPKSDLLMSFIYRDNSFEENDDDFLRKLNGANNYKNNTSKKNEGFKYELQYLYRDQYYNLTTGLGYFTQQSKEKYLFDSDSILGYDLLNRKDNYEHANLYLYADLKIIPKTIATVGLSQDFYGITGNTNFNSNPINPKFGLLWRPTKNTTLRFAAFSVLKRNQLENQTLEPTQVAGFNQFFDDPDGTYSRRIGVGIDHKLSDTAFIGMEASLRRLRVPFKTGIVDEGIQGFGKTSWNENNVRGYVNWSPNDLVALSAEYLYEEFKRNIDYYDPTIYAYNGAWTYLKTHKTRLSGIFFHPTGFIAKLNLNYIDQTGDFFDTNTQSPLSFFYPNISNNSSFWTVDAEIGYRLTKRHGLFTLGVKNLFNEKFNYQSTDFNQPGLQQGGRFLFGRVTLSF